MIGDFEIKIIKEGEDPHNVCAEFAARCESRRFHIHMSRFCNSSFLMLSTANQPAPIHKFAVTMDDRDQGMFRASRESIAADVCSLCKLGSDVVESKGPTMGTFSSTLRRGNVDNPTSSHAHLRMVERCSAALSFEDTSSKLNIQRK